MKRKSWETTSFKEIHHPSKPQIRLFVTLPYPTCQGTRITVAESERRRCLKAYHESRRPLPSATSLGAVSQSEISGEDLEKYESTLEDNRRM
jgi:hypothetical protein